MRKISRVTFEKNNNFSETLIVLLIVIFAFTIRIVSTDFSREVTMNSDAAVYNFAAKNLLEYGVLTYDRLGNMYFGKEAVTPTSALMPGLPLFLAILYTFCDSVAFAYFIQVCLSTITIYFIFKISKLLEVPFFLSCIITVVASVYPGLIYNLDIVLTETLFTTILTGAIYFFLKYLIFKKKELIWLIVSTSLFMSATLVRAQALPFVIIELFFIIVYKNLTRKEKITHCFTVVGIVFLFLAPLWIRNWIQFEEFWILTAAGENPKIWGVQPYFLDMLSTANKTASELAEFNFETSPVTYVKWRIFGFLKFMWYDLWDENLVHPFWYLKPFRLLHPLVVIPAIIGIPFLIKNMRKEILLIASVPILFTIMAMPYHGLARYVFPSIPMVFVLLGVYLNNLFYWIKKRSKKHLGDNLLLCNEYHILDYLFRYSFYFVSIVFSLLLIYSVYVFPISEAEEMSNFRLERTYGISTKDVDKLDAIEEIELINHEKLWSIANAENRGEHLYKGVWDAIPILTVDIPNQIYEESRQIISKVELDIPGGYYFDYCTIYWTTEDIPNFSENYVYGRFARNSYMDKIIVYIDGDINGLMVVPVGFRGSSFSINSIHITKYQI